MAKVLVFTFSGQAQKAGLSSVIINTDGKDGKHICVMPRTRCQVLNRSARSKVVQGVELQKGESCWSYLAFAHGVQVASVASLHFLPAFRCFIASSGAQNHLREQMETGATTHTTVQGVFSTHVGWKMLSASRRFERFCVFRRYLRNKPQSSVLSYRFHLWA